MTTPVSSCGIPRKSMRSKSNPAVNVMAPGFGSAEPWACAGDRWRQRTALSPGHSDPPNRRSMHAPPPKRPGSVREADPERTDHLVAFATVEELRGRAERLVFYAAVHVPRAEAGRATERYCHDSRDAEEPELVVLPSSS